MKDKIEKQIESAQDKAYTQTYFDKKIKLEAENDMMQAELQNYQLKAALKQAKTHATGLTPIK